MGYTDVCDYVGGKMDWFAAGLPRAGEEATTTRLADLTRPAPSCPLDAKVGEARDCAEADDDTPLVVINEQSIVLGVLRVETLALDASRAVAELMQEGPSTFRPNVSVTEMRDQLDKEPVARILVTRSDGELVGWVDPEAVRRAAEEVKASDEPR